MTKREMYFIIDAPRLSLIERGILIKIVRRGTSSHVGSDNGGCLWILSWWLGSNSFALLVFDSMVSGVSYHVAVSAVCYFLLVASTAYILATMRPNYSESKQSEDNSETAVETAMNEIPVDQEISNELAAQKTRICFFGNFILGAILTFVLSAILQPSNWVTWLLISVSLTSVIKLSGVLSAPQIQKRFSFRSVQVALWTGIITSLGIFISYAAPVANSL